MLGKFLFMLFFIFIGSSFILSLYEPLVVQTNISLYLKKNRKKLNYYTVKYSHVRSRQINILFFGSPRVLFKADKNFFFYLHRRKQVQYLLHSVRSSATLRGWLVCVICNSNSFHSSSLKLCSLMAHILKMCTSYYKQIR